MGCSLLKLLLLPTQEIKEKIKAVGVGKVTAIQLLVATDGFTKFDTVKQLASYCGVVLFENSSGKFKGKARVSKMANRTLKKQSCMCVPYLL